MEKKMVKFIRVGIGLAICLGFAAPALATQTHGEPEGLVAHQIAHLFFAFSMGLLIYWLRTGGLTLREGWRHIQYAAILLIVWNLDAFFVHLMDEFTGLLDIERPDAWRIRVLAEEGWSLLAPAYYLAKLDHLWCVPALVLLYTGLRRLAKTEPPLSGPPRP